MNRTGTRLRSLSALLLALGMVLCLSACGGSDFDAAKYVDATMKLFTTGDATELKTFEGKAVIVDEKEFKQELEQTLNSIAGSAGATLPESIKPKAEEALKSMMGNISDTVGEATKLTEGSAEGYEVPLTIKPLKLNMQDEMTKALEGLRDELTEEDLQDSEAVYGKVYEKMFDVMGKVMDKKEYGEEKTFQVPVTKNKDGLYTIDGDTITQAIQASYTTDLMS